jgi:acetylornithine deacetylase/succinyl-diaminopimelate desuccinylase-like protein
MSSEVINLLQRLIQNACVALVPHFDVVPVDLDGWTHDPFGAELVDGFVYGRGAVDMLNLAVAFAAAVRRYVALCVRVTCHLLR